MKTIVLTAIGTVFAVVIIGLSTFFIFLEGEVQTLVPNVTGRPLVEALLELQEKELQAEIQLRYSSDPATKGHILEQNPSEGNLVRAGRSIQLMVSEGAVVDTVTDFIGQNLDEVRAYLRTISATYEPLMRIGSISYVFSDQEPGTVLEQSPAPGTQLDSFTDLDIVVSRGPDISRSPVPRYIGMSYQDALELVISQGRVFEFAFADSEPNPDRPVGTVTAQSPEPGEEAPERGRVILQIVPEAETEDGSEQDAGSGEADDEVFDIFYRRLPEYPVRVELTLQLISSDGTIETLVEAQHAGGIFAVPYRATPGDTLVLSRLGTEIVRQVVQ
ncbi:MAG: PASTA domain-containing protein [Spirochaeta sp.]